MVRGCHGPIIAQRHYKTVAEIDYAQEIYLEMSAGDKGNNRK